MIHALRGTQCSGVPAYSAHKHQAYMAHVVHAVQELKGQYFHVLIVFRLLTIIHFCFRADAY